MGPKSSPRSYHPRWVVCFTMFWPDGRRKFNVRSQSYRAGDACAALRVWGRAPPLRSSNPSLTGALRPRASWSSAGGHSTPAAPWPRGPKLPREDRPRLRHRKGPLPELCPSHPTTSHLLSSHPPLIWADAYTDGPANSGPATGTASETGQTAGVANLLTFIWYCTGTLYKAFIQLRFIQLVIVADRSA